jgi:malonyl-CoA/methylmalonyl-CoA synthetase
LTTSPLIERLLLARSGGATLSDSESGEALSIADLVDRALGIARGLGARYGSLRGERVLIAVPPGIGWAEAFVAVVLAGAVAVPIPLAAPAAEVAYFVEDAGATLAFADDERAARLPKSVRVVDRSALGGDAAAELAALAATDPALILYTSGTTGKPKGAVITHANLAAQTAALRAAWGMRPTDVLLHVLPMHHLHGVVVAFLNALTTPCSIRMLSRFDPALVIDEMPRATVFMAVPTMYQRLLDAVDRLQPEARDRFADAARSLRLATSGSAALPATLAERWRAVGGSIPLERYGMTEIGMALSNPLDPAGRVPGSVGAPLPSVEIRIVDDRFQDTETGELWVRGPSVFAGYHGREAATRDAFQDGWFRTGDVARREPAGHIVLLGRTSVDILKSGGEKISALEVEEVLRDHPSIAEVAVVGVPDSEWGDRVTAVAVLKDGAALDLDTLRAWAKERLLPYKVPRALVVVDELPRNAMGKVQKNRVKAIVGDRSIS